MVGWQLLWVGTVLEGKTKSCVIGIFSRIVEDLKCGVLSNTVADVKVHRGEDGVLVWVVGAEHGCAAEGVSNEMLLPGLMYDVEVVVDKLLTKSL